MLMLSRHPDQTIVIGDDIRITICKVRGDAVSIGIEAPRSIPIVRGEVLQAEQQEPKAANDADDETGIAEPARDWAVLAARAVLADLCDRRGIKHELTACDHDVRCEMVQSLADIIRAAKEQPQ